MVFLRLVLVIFVAIVTFELTAFCAEPNGARAPFNLNQRQLWKTGNIQGSPEPPDPYATENAFPKIRFFEPLSVGLIPGQSRFGVATRPGKIFTFAANPDVTETQLLLDVEKTTYGLVFHPQFAKNGYFYVMSIQNQDPEATNGSRVSRFQVKPGGQLVADRRSEKVIIEWPAGGHNGGCLRFGGDGYLYIATGDGSGIADGLQTGQKIDDLLGSILRIDVDRPDAQRGYSIPKDNPFVSVTGARGEIWSFGHRQVWKFSFDNQNRLWAGEVGQDLWETVYLIQRGGNYGWSINEGKHPFRPDRPKGPGPFQPPLIEHSHSDFRSLTGGYVFQSDRLPELKGAYIYGDYDTGKLWTLKVKGTEVIENRELADTQIRIVEFAQDSAGEVYLVDFAGGGFHRIVKAPPQAQTKPFPRKLSETGLFASTKDHLPAAGLIPYSVNAPLWSDGAEKDRFIALPGDTQIEFDTVTYPHGPEYPDRGWRFPNGTVLVKTFSLELEKGNHASSQRLETRLLIYRKMPGNEDEYGAQFWSGYTYVWNADQSDAALLDSSGLDRKLTIKDAAAPDGQREQVWRFPSRAECALCHNMAAKYVLGVTTLQMNKLHHYGDETSNQLEILARLRVFTDKLPKSPENLPRLVDYHDTTADLRLRARSYLHANCAHCHRRWGGGNAEFDLQASIPFIESQAVNTRPGQGTFQLRDPKIVAPGDPGRSLILERMKITELGRMPHVASKLVDTDAVNILARWIEDLKNTGELDKVGAINPR